MSVFFILFCLFCSFLFLILLEFFPCLHCKQINKTIANLKKKKKLVKFRIRIKTAWRDQWILITHSVTKMLRKNKQENKQARQSVMFHLATLGHPGDSTCWTWVQSELRVIYPWNFLDLSIPESKSGLRVSLIEVFVRTHYPLPCLTRCKRIRTREEHESAAAGIGPAWQERRWAEIDRWTWCARKYLRCPLREGWDRASAPRISIGRTASRNSLVGVIEEGETTRSGAEGETKEGNLETWKGCW